VRVGIDNISPGEATARNGPGGMRAYLQSLLSEFAKHAPQHHFVVTTPDWADPLMDKLPDNVEVVSLTNVPVNRAKRIVYQQTALPSALKRQHLDVFFATATVAPLLCSAPMVLAVQFTQFYRWPKAYGRARTAYLKRFLPASLRRVKRAIIFTESARQDLVRWTGVPIEKVRVVPHGLSEEFWRAVESDIDSSELDAIKNLVDGQPFILYVSATYGYKNHARLIEAFGLLKQRLKLPHVLLLVGSAVDVSFAELRAVAERAGVCEQVIFAGRLDSAEQIVAAYKSADLSVIPTLYETFGFPVLEAMACGCPLVASNAGSMAELSGDAAILVNPLDIVSIADGMEKALLDTSLRERLVARGRERARSFTYKRSAIETLEILEEAARA